jgi:hypothetical protein
MKSKTTVLVKRSLMCAALSTSLALSQSAAPVAVPAAEISPAQGAPVSYASVTELNNMLTQLDSAAKDTQTDLGKLRIDRWRTDNSAKKQTLTNVESIQRNLKSALPEIMGSLRAAPEDLPATFRLYRNLDALYDVLGNVVESTGAFGSKDEFQSLANDLNTFETTRRQLAERIENLSTAKEAEIVRLRADLKTAQTAPAAPPKKVVVDDTAPAKKPVTKKKLAAKPSTSSTSKPPAGQAQPAQQPANPQ